MARRSVRRTDYTWFGAADAVTTIDLGTGTAAVLGNTVVVNSAGTLVRLRGQVYVQLDTSAVDERAMIAVGIIKATDEAVAAGVASLPHPHSDGDAEWIWHRYLSISSLAEPAVVTDALFDRAIIDSKAMRRFKQNEVVVLVAEVADGLDQGGTWDMMYGYRVLFGT